jgi:hypothetical protein
VFFSFLIDYTHPGCGPVARFNCFRPERKQAKIFAAFRGKLHTGKKAAKIVACFLSGRKREWQPGAEGYSPKMRLFYSKTVKKYLDNAVFFSLKKINNVKNNVYKFTKR